MQIFNEPEKPRDIKVFFSALGGTFFILLLLIRILLFQFDQVPFVEQTSPKSRAHHTKVISLAIFCSQAWMVLQFELKPQRHYSR